LLFFLLKESESLCQEKNDKILSVESSDQENFFKIMIFQDLSKKQKEP